MTNTASEPLFDTVAFIGMGLIGSSLARRILRDGLAKKITCAVRSEATRDRVLELGIADEAYCGIKEAVKDADLVMICAPVGANEAIGAQLAGNLKKGALFPMSDRSNRRSFATLRRILTKASRSCRAILWPGPNIPDRIQVFPNCSKAGGAS